MVGAFSPVLSSGPKSMWLSLGEGNCEESCYKGSAQERGGLSQNGSELACLGWK